MKVPTSEKYLEAITSVLSAQQIEILKTLYYLPGSSATAKELASALKYASFRAANLQIGTIGKAILSYTGTVPPTYSRRGQPAHYLLIGEYTEAGWAMWDELQEALVNAGYVSKDKDESTITERLPTENASHDEQVFYEEGKVVQVLVNRYERDRKARLKCIEFFGHKCFACDFDFSKVYGPIAEGFIHVHHKKALAEIGGAYKVDPIKDLVPLCANCHSVVHLVQPAMPLEELRKLLEQRAKRPRNPLAS